MRYAEFEAIQRDLNIAPPMEILDVSSPQWFTLNLAERYLNISHEINERIVNVSATLTMA